MKLVSIGVLTAAASGLALGQAAAAAKPHKTPAPPPPPPVAHRWTGFYVGGHLGGGWAGNDAAAETGGGFGSFAPASFGNSGSGSFLGGAQVGYNWQFASPWMVGVEADWTGTKLSQTGGGVLPAVGGGASGYSSTLRRDVNSLMSVRGRVGYVQDAMLYYVTGGGAWGRADYTANTTLGGGGGINFPTSFGDTAHGYVVGGGVEYALNTNWSVRAEYLYYRLGGASQTGVSIPAGNGAVNYSWSGFKANVVRVGVDYQFGQ